MLRRLHTRIIGMGSVCGLAPSPPAEVFLKTLPPPNEVDARKYERFQREEHARTASRHVAAAREPSSSFEDAPEPFFDVAAAAAGHKHVAMVTREGNLISVGDNRYGQTGALNTEEGEEARGAVGGERESILSSAPTQRGGAAPAPQLQQQQQSLHRPRTSSVVADLDPLYIDLDGAFRQTNPNIATRVCCGSNFTIVYQQGGRRAIAFGNNHMGQLGAGHKHRVDSVRGFTEWDPTAAWWPSKRSTVVRTITCGFNHAVAQLTDDSLYAFGSNGWGELGIGCTDSPMCPARISFFEQRGLRVTKVALGNSFTLFLTEEGRVFGCGATNDGQLPPNTFDPVPLALIRSFQHGQPRSSTASSSPSATPPVAPVADGTPKLIRIKDIACVGSLAVFVSTKNELLLQGSLPEYGVTVPSPRFVVVDQAAAIAHFRSKVSANKAESSSSDFDVVELVGGSTTLLVRYRNGCVAALGANTEGQLQNVTKVLNGKRINLAPACHTTELFPMLAPARHQRWDSSWFVSGKGFNLLFDHNEVYLVPESAPPIELPPGNGDVHRLALARQNRLRASLK